MLGNNTSAAILRTVVYSQMFNYALTYDELWRYLISDKKIPLSTIRSQLTQGVSTVTVNGSFIFIQGNEDNAIKRTTSESLYRKKIAIAKKVSRLLSYIPSIYFIGLSGSLAAGTVREDDDIDFFIITYPHTVWITRVICIVLLTYTRQRRIKNEKNTRNKICLNSFISYTEASYFNQFQDLYTAHELTQLHPLINYGETYENFIHKNNWYKRFLPNAELKEYEMAAERTSHLHNKMLFFLQIFDPICYFLQLLYMWHSRTKEIVTKEIILLHPVDYRQTILEKFTKQMMVYDSLTKV